MKTRSFQRDNSVLKTVIASFNCTEESLDEDIENLQEWLRTQHHLPEIMDDKSLRNFLFLNKCSIEKTKQKLDMYYTMRSRMADIFEHINPKLPNMKKVMDAAYIVSLPRLTKEMYTVSVLKIRDVKLVDDLDITDAIRLALNLQELRLRTDVLMGDITILDCQDLNTTLLAKVTPMVIWKIFKIYNVFSTPLRAVYIINTRPFMLKFLSTVKPLLKAKIFERIYICENVDKLLEKLPKSVLPKDYGGTEKSLEELQESLKLDFSENRDIFDRVDQLRVDESLRPEELKNREDLGFYGNFKKLNID